MSIFPITRAANDRYDVDNLGRPFPSFGEASWDAHINLSLTDLRTYLDDCASRGFQTLFTYIHTPSAYYNNSNAPWAAQLGGSGAGTAALPFTQNISGGAWNGDPTFANFDAAFSSPNDAYHAWVLTFLQEADNRNINVRLCFMYLGFNQGANDGWCQTLNNTGNTTTVCTNYGTYLANGHGTFTGFKNQPNIVWVSGGDTTPPNGSTQALRTKAILQAMQAAGDTHLVASHWQAGTQPSDQTDLASLLTEWHVYTHGTYPTAASTAAMARGLYSAATTTPVSLIETNYWGNYGQPRASVRLFQWHAWLSAIGGAVHGFSPFWGFALGTDGSTGSSNPGSTTTAWQASFNYTANPFGANTYVSHGTSPKRWYILMTAGTSAASGGPTGTGSSIVDGGCVWSYVADVSANVSGMATLFNAPGRVDNQQVGAIMKSLSWWRLVPSGLGGMITLITSNGGTAPTWTDGNNASGGMNWIAAAADPAGSVQVAYVPDQHAGAFTMDLSKVIGPYRIDFYDPTLAPSASGATQNIARYSIAASMSLTVPAGANAGGADDWVVIARPEGYVPPSGVTELC